MDENAEPRENKLFNAINNLKPINYLHIFYIESLNRGH